MEKRIRWCESCGKELLIGAIRCPQCGKIVCNKCSLEYHDKDIEIDRMICKDCNLKNEKERESQEKEERKKEMIFYGKILLTSLVVLLILKLAVR